MNTDNMRPLWVCGPAASIKPNHPLYSEAMFANCEVCGTDIVHRNNAPEDAMKLCMGCATVIARTQAKHGAAPVIVTRETDDEDFDRIYGKGSAKRTLAMAKKILLGKEDDDD